jgi:pimeloyl-ACP methyl ester carboxylesterase
VTLAGTLTTPQSTGRHPAIVFTHGGGPDTRDLSRFYADHFARIGIASLIYDKRGVGASAPELDWGRSSFNDLAGDALAGVQLLRTRVDVDSKRIGLYGPSNGGWVVEYAAAHSKDVAFIIVISGGGIPSWESEVHRVEAQARAGNFSEDAIKEAVAFMHQKFEVARTGQGWEQLQKLIDSSRDAKWFRFVNVPRSLDGLREAWTGQFRYDPYSDLSKLRIPVLAIFGELDTETPAKQISARTEEALRKGGNNRYIIRVFPSANHGIMIFHESGKPWHFFGFADGYVDLISLWVLKQTRPQGRRSAKMPAVVIMDRITSRELRMLG